MRSRAIPVVLVLFVIILAVGLNRCGGNENANRQESPVASAENPSEQTTSGSQPGSTDTASLVEEATPDAQGLEEVVSAYVTAFDSLYVSDTNETMRTRVAPFVHPDLLRRMSFALLPSAAEQARIKQGLDFVAMVDSESLIIELDPSGTSADVTATITVERRNPDGSVPESESPSEQTSYQRWMLWQLINGNWQLISTEI
jgi:hypothetical protein